MLAGVIILMGIITAESYYPFPYTTHLNEISDLGATRPPNSVIHQPSATIFNITMLVSGAMILMASSRLYRENKSKLSVVMIGLLGLGIFGVGVFPGNNAVTHPLFAMMAFLFGGLAAIFSRRITVSPFSLLATLLGGITLFALILNGQISEIIGMGGAERWVAYPVVAWLIGYGGYLLGKYSPETV